MIHTLRTMLTYCRPHGSRTERQFIRRYITPLPGAWVDSYRNWHVEIPTRDGVPSRVMWSCHTDTVHRTAGRQYVQLSAGILSVDQPQGLVYRSNCLGADDTAGVFLCSEMIRARVPGHYIFHYGEEVGGIGSSALARNHAEWLTQSFDCAIAFDRKGTGDVITHQGWTRTASDAFARSLAAALNINPESGLMFRPCSEGIYTDTAEYARIIPECTNVSVGYEHAHSPAESLDTGHVLRLRAALLALDPSTLVIEGVAHTPDHEDDPSYDYWFDEDFVDDPTYLDRDYARVIEHLKTVNRRVQ